MGQKGTRNKFGWYPLVNILVAGWVFGAQILNPPTTNGEAVVAIVVLVVAACVKLFYPMD